MSDLKQLLAQAEERNAAFAASQQDGLALAKKEAQTRGKEPFNARRLQKYVDTGSDPAQLERHYYLHHPEVMTLEAFAAVLDPA